MKVVADDRSPVEMVYMFAGEVGHSLAEVVEVYMFAEVGTLTAGCRAIAEADRRAGKIPRNLWLANNCAPDGLDDQRPVTTKSIVRRRFVGSRMAGYAEGTLLVCPSIPGRTQTDCLSDRARGIVQAVP